jgi:hypothetical protein
MLAMLALAPCPAAAMAITYDFSGTLAHGTSLDPNNTSITGQFNIDFDTQSVTAFHFLTPVIEIDASQWTRFCRRTRRHIRQRPTSSHCLSEPGRSAR